MKIHNTENSEFLHKRKIQLINMEINGEIIILQRKVEIFLIIQTEEKRKTSTRLERNLFLSVLKTTNGANKVVHSHPT